MGIREFDMASKIMEEHPDLMDFEGVKPLTLVEAAESTLGYVFPPTYRKFLLAYGAGNFGATEVYGLVGNDFTNSGVPDAVWYTQRKVSQAVLPKGYLVIYNTGDGGLYCLDLNEKTSDGESPVRFVRPGAPLQGQPSTPIAPDFGTLLLRLVEDELNS